MRALVCGRVCDALRHRPDVSKWAAYVIVVLCVALLGLFHLLGESSLLSLLGLLAGSFAADVKDAAKRDREADGEPAQPPDVPGG